MKHLDWGWRRKSKFDYLFLQISCSLIYTPLLINSSTYFLTYSLTHSLYHSFIHSSSQSLTNLHIHSLIHWHTCEPTNSLIYSPPCPLWLAQVGPWVLQKHQWSNLKGDNVIIKPVKTHWNNNQNNVLHYNIRSQWFHFTGWNNTSRKKLSSNGTLWWLQTKYFKQVMILLKCSMLLRIIFVI